jgi:hypothetical protein
MICNGPRFSPDQEQVSQQPARNGSRRLYGVGKVEVGEDSDGSCPLPSKPSRRQRATPSTRLIVRRRSNRQKTHLNSGNSSPRSPSDRGRYRMPSPPDLQSSDGEPHTQAPRAKFEEWPLGQAFPKRITLDGSVSFQLQFTWEPCKNEKGGADGGSSKNLSPRTPARKSMAKRSTARNAFTPKENRLLITLKNQGLSWEDIHT